MNKLHVIDHPLIKHKLSIIRNKDTDFKDFREVVSELAFMVCYEASRDLPLVSTEIVTPVAPTTAYKIG